MVRWFGIACMVGCNGLALPDGGAILRNDLAPFSLSINGEDTSLGSVQVRMQQDRGPQLDVSLWTGGPCNPQFNLSWWISLPPVGEAPLGEWIDLSELRVQAQAQCDRCEPLAQVPQYDVTGRILLHQLLEGAAEFELELEHEGDFEGATAGRPTAMSDLSVTFDGAARVPGLFGDCFGVW